MTSKLSKAMKKKIWDRKRAAEVGAPLGCDLPDEILRQAELSKRLLVDMK